MNPPQVLGPCCGFCKFLNINCVGNVSNALTEQPVLLEKQQSRKILTKVQDDAASPAVLRDVDSIFSGFTGLQSRSHSVFVAQTLYRITPFLSLLWTFWTATWSAWEIRSHTQELNLGMHSSQPLLLSQTRKNLRNSKYLCCHLCMPVPEVLCLLSFLYRDIVLPAM